MPLTVQKVAVRAQALPSGNRQSWAGGGEAGQTYSSHPATREWVQKGRGREGRASPGFMLSVTRGQEGKLRPGERRNKASGLGVCKPGSKFLPHLNKQGELGRKHWAQGRVPKRGAGGLPIHSASREALGRFLYLPLSQFLHL